MGGGDDPARRPGRRVQCPRQDVRRPLPDLRRRERPRQADLGHHHGERRHRQHSLPARPVQLRRNAAAPTQPAHRRGPSRADHPARDTTRPHPRRSVQRDRRRRRSAAGARPRRLQLLARRGHRRPADHRPAADPGHCRCAGRGDDLGRRPDRRPDRGVHRRSAPRPRLGPARHRALDARPHDGRRQRHRRTTEGARQRRRDPRSTPGPAPTRTRSTSSSRPGRDSPSRCSAPR